MNGSEIQVAHFLAPPPCSRFEYDPNNDDPADPDRAFCWCGWTEQAHEESA